MELHKQDLSCRINWPVNRHFFIFFQFRHRLLLFGHPAPGSGSAVRLMAFQNLLESTRVIPVVAELALTLGKPSGRCVKKSVSK